jgi:membrane protease YdiL (CAAX protease family)
VAPELASDRASWGAEVRAVAAAVVLSGVWAVAFATRLLPFFPTIVVGGALTGLAGWWVRRAGHTRVSFPPLTLTRGQAGLASLVAVLHLAGGHVLFRLGEWVLPALTETASSVYGRADGSGLWIALLLGGVVIAPLEEVFWRGAVQPLTVKAVRDRLPRLAALPGGGIVATALVYALFHVATGQLALVAGALLGGLVWGWLLERTGSVGATMLAHGLWTALMLAFPPL